MSADKAFDPVGSGASYPFGNKVMRAIWIVAWLLLARWTPPPLFAWRRLVCRMFGARIGQGVRIYGSVTIWHPRQLIIGQDVIVGPGVHLYNQGQITIQDRAIISQRAHLCASSHNTGDPAFRLIERPIIIGPSCWIAAEAFVGPGVRMAEGSVLGARGALFENSEAWTIYRGNPAVAIARRHLRAS